jgi:GMP synthase (glutamine-hydrolysing)
VEVIAESQLFRGLPAKLDVWMSHGDEAKNLPAGFVLTAKTANALAGIADEERRIWAVQFHPEVVHTRHGMELLRNFVLGICGAKADWTPEHFIQSTVERVRAQVGEGHAICGLSGGVDSSVAAVLVARAIGDRLTCIFVNNGVLRKDEFAKVQKSMREQLGLRVVAVDASERFLTSLAGVTDPERGLRR